MKLIDTSLIIEFLRGKIDLPEDSVFCVINYYELYWKALQKNAKKELKIIERLFSLSKVFGIDLKVAKEASFIKFKLDKIGARVNDFDILIYAIALANGIEEIWTKDKDFLVISKVFPEVMVKLF